MSRPRVVVEEQQNRVIVQDDVVRVVSVAQQGPPGPQGPQGEPGEGGGAELPEAAQGSLLVRGADDWEPLGAGAEGEALVVADGVPAWGEVASAGGLLPPLAVTKGTAFNQWIIPGWAYESFGTSVHQGGVIYYQPIYVSYAMTFDQAAVNVTTANVEGIARLGLYEWDSGLPTNLIADWGAVPLTTTGEKSVAFDAPLTLSPGYYFTAVAIAASSDRVSLRSISNAFASPVLTWISFITSGTADNCILRSTGNSDVPVDGFPDQAAAPNSSGNYSYMTLFLRRSE